MVKLEKAIEQLKSLQKKISIVRPKIDVQEIRSEKVTSYGATIEEAWTAFKKIHASQLPENSENEELISLYADTEELYVELNEILTAFRNAAKAKVEGALSVEQSKKEKNKGEQVISTVDRKKKRFYLLQNELEGKLDEIKETLEALSESVIEVRKHVITREFQDLKKLYDVLIEDPEYDDIRDDYISVRREYDALIEHLALKADQKKNVAGTSHTELERVKIPIFTGVINEWPAFHDLFLQMVDAKPLPDVEKLYRLKTIVKGDAGLMIQHLKVTDENYKAAWNILKNRFDNRRLLFSTIVDKLFDQPSINSQDVASIKKLLDTTTECLQALTAMGVSLEDTNPFIARNLIRKLDREGLIWYEQSVQKTKEIQTLEDVMSFLERQYLAQEAIKTKKASSAPLKATTRYSNSFQTMQLSCKYCSMTSHNIEECRKFLALPLLSRKSWVNKEKLCELCLSHKSYKKCYKYKNSCSKCGRKHNTLLHYTEFEKKPDQQDVQRSTNMVTRDSASLKLLASAQIKIKSALGEQIILRALIDPCAQHTSISEEAAQILQLPRKKIKTEIYGMFDTMVGVSKAEVEIAISPRFNSDTVHYSKALVVSTVTSALPEKSFKEDMGKWSNYCLADPNFYKSDRIDVVIGVELYQEIVKLGVAKKGKLLAQETTLGWIICGVLNIPCSGNKVVMAVTKGIERFWELEEIAEDSQNNEDDDRCENLFATTTTLDEEDRLVVKLPFKADCELGDSRKMAMARLLSLERKLTSNPKLKAEYHKFMEEYVNMGHMEKLIEKNTGKYYMPHQAVIRDDHATTKVRVVFDASAKSTNGRSLNDVLHIGPKLQHDIFEILIKWRLWQYVITADVEKMYRQIKTAEEDQSYQTILWRSNPKKPIDEYKLKTVTYGTGCAPFLAKRALLEIANNCKEVNRKIYSIIKDDFYMDDLMTGADTKEDCIYIQKEVNSQLKKFGFHLRKWLSNERNVLAQIPDVGNNKIVEIKEGETIKTLGVQWEPEADQFTFYFKVPESSVLSKRLALSTLAKIFDPLGWLAPITTLAKLFIQKLWLMDLEWDAKLSEELSKEWRNILKNISIIGSVNIPRWLNTTTGSEWELHGFADASGKAYAAVVYAKVGLNITLIAAKSKVNPIKNRKTLPKLELCAAHLLAKLINKILILIHRNVKIFAWGDSTIALTWVINKEKAKDKFIRTRVAEIKELIPTAKWNHVRTKDNPADAASRGMIPEKLVENSLWWNGPTWLKKNENEWPKQVITTTFTAVTTINQSPNFLDDLVVKISGYDKLIRVVAYVLKFINKLRRKRCPEYLSTDEISNARTLLVRNVQLRLFSEEINWLKNKKEIPTKSKICSLNPFLDEKMILRVGGRLSNSDLCFNRKHPILLTSCRFTDLMLNWVHCTTLHGGAKLMESVTRRMFWIIGSKNCIKKQIRSCVRCQRYRQQVMTQMMGDLPENRIAVTHPFTHVGVDYAGPVQMRVSRGRGQKSFKGYIAVFVCMASKAVHLEAVSELSTEAFMAALRRFFARRGKSAHIYSDNGTNFVGAARKIEKEYEEALKNNSSIAGVLAAENIKWHFIPPGAPHFGGIWEAAVKSVKHHLRRVVGEAKLTFEEMSTLLAQVEGVLNSRPLCELSCNADEVEVLTPGHFLVGRPLLDLPDECNDIDRVSSLNRWKLLQKMKRDFWKQWKEEYLATLQQRRKWKHSMPNISKDQLVLIKDENTSPARWPLGRVINTHAGKDGKVRVVTMKLQQGVMKRPISKICPLESVQEPEIDVQRSTTYLSTSQNTAKSYDGSLSKIMLVMLMMLFGNVVSANNTTKTEITTFNEKTAIYLDNLGTIDVSASSWNLVIHYDLKPYISSLEQVANITYKSKAVCSKIGEFEEQCESTLSRMKERIEIVQSTNQLFALNQMSRQKRGIDFIGSFYHLLFGLMDNDDRQDLERDMKNLLENQYNIKDLIRNQTSTVDSTMNLFTKSVNEVNAKFTVLQTRIDNITLMVQEKMFIYKESIKFFAIARQIEAQLEEVEKTQSQIIHLLMDINHGKVSPDLLKPDQLSHEVTKIKEWLPENMRLPGSKGNQLSTVLKMMTAKAIILDDKLVIKTRIPLISSRSSNVFKVVAIPVQQASNVVVASIPNPYLVYSYDADVYHLMSDIEFHSCKEINDRQFLCEGGWAWKDSNTNECEMAPLKPHKDVNCHFIEVSYKHTWVKLSHKHTWLFKTNANSTLHVYCGVKKQDLIKLPKQGVLKLSSGCSGQEGRTILPASSDRSESIEGSFGTYLINEISYNTSQFIKPLGSMVIDHSAEIGALKEEIKHLKATDVHLKGLNFHHATGHLSLIIIGICIVIAVIYFIRKCILKNRAGILVIRRPQNVQI